MLSAVEATLTPARLPDDHRKVDIQLLSNLDTFETTLIEADHLFARSGFWIRAGANTSLKSSAFFFFFLLRSGQIRMARLPVLVRWGKSGDKS